MNPVDETAARALALKAADEKVALALKGADAKVRVALEAADDRERERIAALADTLRGELHEAGQSRSAITAGVEEAIRITAWRNIRRYVILGNLSFLILEIVLTLVVVLIVSADTRSADKARATAACQNTAALAAIEHTRVVADRKASDDLIKRGETFGLSKKRFEQLVAAGRKQSAVQLQALDKLAKADCENI